MSSVAETSLESKKRKIVNFYDSIQHGFAKTFVTFQRHNRSFRSSVPRNFRSHSLCLRARFLGPAARSLPVITQEEMLISISCYFYLLLRKFGFFPPRQSATMRCRKYNKYYRHLQRIPFRHRQVGAETAKGKEKWQVLSAVCISIY